MDPALQCCDLFNNYFRLFVLHFLVLDFLISRDGEIEPVLLDLADGHKEALSFPVLGILFLPVADIRWVGAEENYVRLCTGPETHLLRETMSHLEGRLDSQAFLRVHRSFIVNLNYVKEVRTEQDGESVVVMTDGQKVAMSRAYRSRIMEWLHR